MPEFTNFKDAFAWWVENEYPKLPKEEKAKLLYKKADFLRGRSISDNLIQEIMRKYGNLEVKIKFEP